MSLVCVGYFVSNVHYYILYSLNRLLLLLLMYYSFEWSFLQAIGDFFFGRFKLNELMKKKRIFHFPI